jgi:hypothetical protein
MRSVSTGSRAGRLGWTGFSDHAPVIVDLDLDPARPLESVRADQPQRPRKSSQARS